jgi:release factor H-coupled RctB family protein
MPDLHPGKGIPIGATIITEGIIYPELVDCDIGCGMSFVKTGMKVSKLTAKKLDKLSKWLVSIDCPWSNTMEAYHKFFDMEFEWGNNKVEPLDITKLDKNHLGVLGTIGGGNHFAEF